MHIKYKIMGYSEAEHTIVVRFYTDVTTEEDLAIRDVDTDEIIRHSDGSIKTCRTDFNLNLWDDPVLTGEAFEEMISHQAPRQWFELLEKVKNPDVDTSLAHMDALVGKERDVVPLPPRVLTAATA